jgi:hypothetical protein
VPVSSHVLENTALLLLCLLPTNKDIKIALQDISSATQTRSFISVSRQIAVPVSYRARLQANLSHRKCDHGFGLEAVILEGPCESK